LVAVSMGGAIAQHMALAAPERIRTLTLCVTWGGTGAVGEFQTRIWAPQVLRASFEERVDELLFRCYSEEFFQDPERVEFARNVMLNHPHPQSPEAFVRQLTACGRHEVRARLGELRMPVHVVGAEHDILVPVWKSEEVAELIPGAKLTVVERGAHGMNWERPEEFNQLVLDFVESHAREETAA
jgi:pimeloyl-ACP methyl ester carboxylesterase